MKRTFVIVAIVVFASAVLTSCAASRGARGGCKGTQGYVGYGGR